MSRDPNDPLGPELRRMMEQAATARRFSEISESSAMVAFRQAEEWQMTYRPFYDTLNAIKVQQAAILGISTLASTMQAALSASVPPAISGVVWRDQAGAYGLQSLTSDLIGKGVLSSVGRDVLGAAGMLQPNVDVLRSLAPTAVNLPAFASTIASVSTTLDGRLRALGVDPMIGTALATSGIAAHFANVDVRLQSALSPQWQAFGALSAAVTQLWTAPEVLDRMTGLPGYLRLAPTIEPYASARSLLLFLPADVELETPLILDLMAEEIIDEVDAEFEARLASVDQRLVRPVRGAWQTARSQVDDRVRQSATSVRHVIETLISGLAPRDAVDAWAKEKGFGKKSVVPAQAKEARSAKRWAPQLRYIMRRADEDVGGESLLSSVAEVDLADMLLLLERLNRAVHEGDGEIATNELSHVLRRATAFMTLLLDAYDM